MRKINKTLLICLVLLVGLGLIVVAGCSDTSDRDQKPSENKGSEKVKDDKIVMRYSHGTSPTLEDPHHWSAVKFKELVEEYSDGRIEVEIYPAGQLGSEERGFQDVQNRVIQATSITSNNTASFSKSIGTFDLPYLFKSYEEIYKTIDTLWDDLDNALIEESGNRSIIWFAQGFRNPINSKRPVETIDDIQGLKIRVPPNPIMVGTYGAWGAQPTPVAWDETFSALQQGVVDGTCHPYSIILSVKLFEVTDYITALHYKPAIYHVVVNERWFQGLPLDLQDAVLKAGKETSVQSREVFEKLEDEALRVLIEEKGMKFSGVPKDEIVWMEKAMTIWPEFYNEIGGTELLGKIMDVVGRELPK